MIIGVWSAELMESLDSPPKAMAFPVYVETIAISQAAMSTPIPRTRTRRFLSHVKNLLPLRANIRP